MRYTPPKGKICRSIFDRAIEVRCPALVVASSFFCPACEVGPENIRQEKTNSRLGVSTL